MSTKPVLLAAAFALIATACDSVTMPEGVGEHEPSFASLPDPDSKIAFASKRDGNFEIYIMNGDGSGLINLSNDPSAGDLDPAISPDGRWVVYSKHATGGKDLYVTRADGSGGTYQLTGPPFDEFQPTWSPRGDLVAFASTRGSGTDVWTVPRMRGAWRNLTNDGAAYSPSWSPDGRLIAYVSQKYGTPDIFTVEVNTLAKKLVVGDPSEDIDPTWRPDSRAIAFASDRDGDFDIYTIGLAGGAPHNVTNTSHRDVHPVFAPDGSRIAFETHRSDVFGDVYDMFPSGSTQWPLPNQLGPEIADIQPDWR